MPKSLHQIDFNLLRTLYVLLEEGSVTSAAERMFVSQPAMSKSLSRLRDLFDDPLFVRHGSRLVPTPVAEQLKPPLRDIVTKLENCLDFKKFDPESVKGKVKISAPEQFALLTIPSLLARLQEKAPGLMLEVQYLSGDYCERLANGYIDFAIVKTVPDPEEFVCRTIYSSRPVCWCRRDHPILVKKPTTLEDICAYPLLRLTNHFSDEEIEGTKASIAAAGIKPKLVLETEHMVVAMMALINSDSLLIAPDILSKLSILSSEITSVSIAHLQEFSILKTDLNLVQHQRTANSSLHIWMAEQIANLC